MQLPLAPRQGSVIGGILIFVTFLPPFLQASDFPSVLETVCRCTVWHGVKISGLN